MDHEKSTKKKSSIAVFSQRLITATLDTGFNMIARVFLSMFPARLAPGFDEMELARQYFATAGFFATGNRVAFCKATFSSPSSIKDHSLDQQSFLARHILAFRVVVAAKLRFMLLSYHHCCEPVIHRAPGLHITMPSCLIATPGFLIATTIRASINKLSWSAALCPDRSCLRHQGMLIFSGNSTGCRVGISLYQIIAYVCIN